MQEQDIQAWERELEHSQMMQKQREGWELKEGWDGKVPVKEKPKTLRDILVEHGIGAFKEQDNEK